MLPNGGSSLLALYSTGICAGATMRPWWRNLDTGSSVAVLLELNRAFQQPAQGINSPDSVG